MGFFRRTPRRGPAVQDSLTGQAAAGHPAKDVAAGQASFADVVADRGSLKAQQQADAAAGPPAGPEENGAHASAGDDSLAGSLLPHNGKDQQKQQQPSVAEAVKGPGTDEKGIFIDEEELLSRSTFPIPPEQLISMAKEVIKTGVHKCGKLAADFKFSAPFIGPLGKVDFANTMEQLNLDEPFPDLAPRVYHVRVDPLNPNRVWFTTRPIGTNSGYMTGKLPYPVRPTNKVVELPPQTSSLSFNEQGEVTDFTMGYVMDRRLGSTGGLGGAFGLLYAIGCPFPYPEGHPWQSSWQQTLFNTGNPVLQASMFMLDRVASFFLPNWLYTAHARNMP
ncbi:hypothetical protein OEZ86_007044 [Tetradesmus obliquus]|nr:hypothetical protein OEZ86_007044 [Tetradesmus obliquus]